MYEKTTLGSTRRFPTVKNERLVSCHSSVGLPDSTSTWHDFATPKTTSWPNALYLENTLLTGRDRSPRTIHRASLMRRIMQKRSLSQIPLYNQSPPDRIRFTRYPTTGIFLIHGSTRGTTCSVLIKKLLPSPTVCKQYRM